MPEPVSIGAAVLAVAGVADRLLDVTGARKRLAALEAEAIAIRAWVREEIAKLRTEPPPSTRSTVVAPPPDLTAHEEIRRRLDALERQGDARDAWERSIDVLLARLDERLSARARRARDRGSDA